LTALFVALPGASPLAAETLSLKRAVELALQHSTATAAAAADEQRAFSSYLEARNSYLPQLVLGSGLGGTWGYPLSLEGSAPSIINVTAQSSLINFGLRDFVRSARGEWQASQVQSKDQRNQVIQDTVLAYAELAKWQNLMGHLQQEQDDTRKMEQIVSERIQEGVDSELARSQARLATARVHLRITEAQASIDVLQARLSHLTGLPTSAIQTDTESIPTLPQVNQQDDLAAKAEETSPAVKAAQEHAASLDLKARGEHRGLWPTIDFAAQYALLATFNNYQQFFRPGSFEQHNATVGVVIRFPFLNPSQHAHAQAADAEAIRAHKQAQSAKDQVSEETLRLQRTVNELAAAQQVADLENQVAQATLQATLTRMNSGTATVHDSDDARNQANARYDALQDANFSLERAHIALLRATGQLESWVQSGP
jgi:outer membrane protein TolC